MNNKEKNKFKPSLSWLYGLIILGLIYLIFAGNDSIEKTISWNKVGQLAKENAIEEITVVTNKKEATLKIKADKVGIAFGADSMKYKKSPMMKVNIPSADRIDEKIDEWQKSSREEFKVSYEDDPDYLSGFLYGFGPFILIFGISYLLYRRMNNNGGGGGGIFSVGKSQAKLFDKDNKNKITFKDVAGLSEAKEEVKEIVSFLKNPKHYTELGGKIPKGALLVGPPGTGKTLLAKAVAGEADVPFFSMAGSDFVEMFVGVGASRVRDLFRQAKEKAPCIIFIDEIDAVGRARGKNPNMGANDERENTLNQLLTEMDGFGSNSGVIILAATNRVDILDKALLRAGRFDRQISVDLPDVHDRKEIFEVHLAPVKTDDSIDVDFLARQTPGFSGADIANVCNEAALIAARRNKEFVQKQDFLDAVDRIIGGLEKKNKITTKAEKRSIAVHEAGHATISWMLEFGNPLVKVTIVPRGKALGAAWYLPEERQLTTTQQLLDEMCSLLGGRAAEELFLGNISTGALNDLERATKMAEAMVAYYGLSDKLKNISFYDSTGGEYGFTKPYSERTAQLIDEEVQNIINKQYERAKELLTKYREGHNKLADILFEREVIFAEDVEHVLGKRQWQSRADELIAENDEAKKKAKEQEEKKSTTLDSEKEATPAIESQEDKKPEEDSEDGEGNPELSGNSKNPEENDGKKSDTDKKDNEET